MNVDSMEAGREFDALVQELVIGGQQLYNAYIGGGESGGYSETFYRLPYDQCEALCAANGMGERPLAVAKNYSTDIAAAWEVVKKARAWSDHHRYQFTMRLHWAVEDRIGKNVTDRHVILEAEPVDICRAALRVVLKDSTPAERSEAQE